MRKFLAVASVIAALAAPLGAHAADQKKGTKPAAPAAGAAAETAPADVKRGVIILRSFVAALNSDKVDQARKGRYIACLYNNPVKNISAAAGKVIAANDKLDDDNPTHVFTAASAVCKALPTEAQAPEAGGKPSGKQPEGR